MAYTTYPYNAYIVRKFDDISVDFPAGGVAVADVCMIGVLAGGNGAVEVEVSFSSKEDIVNGEAEWISYESLPAGDGTFISFDPAPNGIRLTGGEGTTAWIKG